MNTIDKETTPQGNDGMPDVGKQPTLAEALKNTASEFRGGENSNAIEDENEGLPSVNRKKRANKLLTVLGALFTVGAAAAIIVSVNSDGKPKQKSGQPETKVVANTLPPIEINPAPMPALSAGGDAPPIVAPGMQEMPVIPMADPGMQPNQMMAPAPIPMQGNTGSGGKPVQSWQDRKMEGDLLISKGGGGGIGGARPAQMPVGAADPGAGLGGSLLGGGGGNDLAAKLEPTKIEGISASILPNRNFLITKGTSLDCVLETAMNSTLPGITTCRLTRDIYSDDGKVLLLDRGSQLVGEYQGGMKQGQSRIFVVWTRAKTPTGVVVNLNSPGADALGRAGFDGHVNTHFWERFGSAIMMSLISDTVSAWAGTGRNNNYGDGTTNNYGNTANAGAKVVEKMLESSANMPPTLTKNQGEPIQIMVARDLDFSSVYSLRTLE